MAEQPIYTEEEVIKHLRDPLERRQAFGEVVGHYSRPLYWQIRRMVLSHDDANDLLQNTFMKAWSSIEYFRGEARLSTWLYRIALNECLSFLSKKHLTVSVDDTEAAAVACQLEADAYFDGNEAQRKFQQALLTLPEKQRMVFNMKYFDEMKYEEMSEIFGTSVGALKASYHHAVKKIERYLQGED